MRMQDPNSNNGLSPRSSDGRFDERDTIFSRIELVPGTSKYREYYSRNPFLQEIDDSLRSGEEGKFSRRLPEAPMVEATFDLISRLRPLVREAPAAGPSPAGIPPNELTSFLHTQARSYGAVRSGGVETEERFFYSVRGRGSRYGETVDRLLPKAFVMAFRMDKREISTAPAIREATEVAGSYLRAAIPALVIAFYLRSIGYEATAHIDGESEVVMPPLAEKAGIGKIGRHGLLVSKTHGSLLRFSVVTTDAPLLAFQPEVSPFPLEKACEACRKCARMCPAGAIPGESVIDRWDSAIRSVDHEACYTMWKRFGTDCGVCLAVCPYSRGAPESHGAPDSHDTSESSGAPDRRSAVTRESGSPDFLKNYMFGRI